MGLNFDNHSEISFLFGADLTSSPSFVLFNYQNELWSTIVPLGKTKVAVGLKCKISFVLSVYSCFFFFAVLVLRLPKRVILFVYLCMQVDSLIELKEHKDLSLAEEADRNWTEIRDQTYLFDRKQREVTAPVSTLFQHTYVFKFSPTNS